MIKSLRIKNLATIEDIELEIEQGFTILTGETGAGKSIVIDGIRLALGEKGSPDMIRTGKKETIVGSSRQYTRKSEDNGQRDRRRIRSQCNRRSHFGPIIPRSL